MRPIKDFGGRIFTSTAAQAQKKKMFNAFSWAKNTARGVRFLLSFNMYQFLAQCEQVCLILALALIFPHPPEDKKYLVPK